MTEKELEKIFAEVRANVYSPEFISKIKEEIKLNRSLDDSGMDSLTLALATNSELDKVFLFRVLAKTLCDKA